MRHRGSKAAPGFIRMRLVTPQDVRTALLTRAEVALFDVREEAHFAQRHPLFAANLPASQLEMQILDRVPRRDVLVTLYDGGDGSAEAAQGRLQEFGYSNVRLLAGGLEAWRRAGYELFQDVNSYSKAFGELVETRRRTPSVSAEELQRIIDSKADVAIADARRADEYQRMNIPTSTSVPGAELVLRAPKLCRGASTTLVVNCAGRTRSIIGAQSLINAGVPNRVVALRNGTIGWTLAGQALEHGQERFAPEVDPADLAVGHARAREVAYRAGVRWLDLEAFRAIEADESRTLYRFDVRTPEEYAAGHLPGFRSAPGGQLVQEADMFAPVRGGRIAIAQDDGGRAEMTASWLAQMGWEAYVYQASSSDARDVGPWRPTLPPLPNVPMIEARAAIEMHKQGAAQFIDVGSSPHYAAGHIEAAGFCLRGDLRQALARREPRLPVVLTSPDGVVARFAASDAGEGQDVLVLAGGTAAWRTAGGPVEQGMTLLMSEPMDVYRRPYEGVGHSVEAMQAYLDWEYGLVEQLERDATHGFVVI